MAKTEHGIRRNITTVGGVIAQLKYHRKIHKQYIKNPKFCKGNSGNVEHHKMAVNAYNQMIKVLQREADNAPTQKPLDVVRKASVKKGVKMTKREIMNTLVRLKRQVLATKDSDDVVYPIVHGIEDVVEALRFANQKEAKA